MAKQFIHIKESRLIPGNVGKMEYVAKDGKTYVGPAYLEQHLGRSIYVEVSDHPNEIGNYDILKVINVSEPD